MCRSNVGLCANSFFKMQFFVRRLDYSLLFNVYSFVLSCPSEWHLKNVDAQTENQTRIASNTSNLKCKSAHTLQNPRKKKPK